MYSWNRYAKHRIYDDENLKRMHVPPRNKFFPNTFPAYKENVFQQGIYVKKKFYSKNYCTLVAKLFLEQKFAKPSVIKFVPHTWIYT